MKTKLKRKALLKKGKSSAEVQELGFGEGVSLKLGINHSNKRRNLDKTSTYKIINYEIKIDVPGKKLNYNEMEQYNRGGEHTCGYLRDIHFYLGKFTGLCALCDDFELCKFPHIIDNTYRNDCPVLSEFDKIAKGNEQERKKNEKKFNNILEEVDSEYIEEAKLNNPYQEEQIGLAVEQMRANGVVISEEQDTKYL